MKHVFLPYRAEFGWKVMAHAPQVHAHPSNNKMVVIEPGDEALYPGCAYIGIERRCDDDRRSLSERELCVGWEAWAHNRGHVAVWPDKAAPRRYFVPQPHAPIGPCVPHADVALCPRGRRYGADKNWRHWPALIELLSGVSLLAVGHPESSLSVPCADSWSESGGRHLDATLCAMHRARVVVATDCGLAHLAVACGRPLVLITHGEGLVADGHDEVGNRYWPVKLDRFEMENDTGSLIRVVHHAWHDARPVAEAVREVMG